MGPRPELGRPAARPYRLVVLGNRLPGIDILVPGELHAGDGPGLQQIDLPARNRPFDVLRQAAMAGRGKLPQFAQRAGLALVQRHHGASLGRHVLMHDADLGDGVAHDLHFLAADAFTPPRQRAHIEDDFVGFEDAGNQTLAQAPARIDDDLIGARVQRVGREHDPTDLGLDHQLDHHRDLRRGVFETRRLAIRHRARRPHRGPAAPDGLGNRVRALDVQVGVMQPGERGLRRVLGCAR